MKIALFAEGSYPYVSGGVSSWINQLVNRMKEHEFIIISIMPSRDEPHEYKYDIPDNITDIKTLYLNDYLNSDPGAKPHEPRFSKAEALQVEKFFKFEQDIYWEEALTALSDPHKLGDYVGFFKSRYFWDMISKYYKEHYNKEEFNLFFWTLRSMFIPLINLMQNDIPEADLYHSVSTGYAGILSLMTKFKYKKPLILTEHGVYSREREEEIIQAKWVTGIYKRFWIDLFYFLSMAVYKHADQTISLFERNREIQLELGSQTDRTFVISNGVDIKRFTIDKEPHEKFILGAILRVVPIKDVKTLIRSFRLIKNVIEDSVLYMIGPFDEDKEYYEECVKMVANMKLENDVIFTGRVDVKEYMKIIDVMVLSSISEGQPLVILEGLASGIPFVSTDVGACKELLEGKENETMGHAGIIVPPVSPYAIFDAVITLYQDESLRKQMGINGRQRIQEYYSEDQFIANYKEIYQKFGR